MRFGIAPGAGDGVVGNELFVPLPIAGLELIDLGPDQAVFNTSTLNGLDLVKERDDRITVDIRADLIADADANSITVILP